MWFGESNPILKVYMKIDIAGDLDNGKFTTKYLLTFSDGDIPWKLKLPKCVALFIIKAEYIAAIEAGKEIVWLTQFFKSLD